MTTESNAKPIDRVISTLCAIGIVAFAIADFIERLAA